MWNVLLVEPWTPGHAPVASEYQPAPVFGGAWVRRPSPVAFAPFLRNEAIVGMTPSAAYFATRSWRKPSAAKKTAPWLAGAGFPVVDGGAAATGAATSPTSSERTRQQSDRPKHGGPWHGGTSRTNRHAMSMAVGIDARAVIDLPGPHQTMMDRTQ